MTENKEEKKRAGYTYLASPGPWLQVPTWGKMQEKRKKDIERDVRNRSINMMLEYKDFKETMINILKKIDEKTWAWWYMLVILAPEEAEV